MMINFYVHYIWCKHHNYFNGISSSIVAEAAANFFNANPRLVLDIASPIIEDTAATISRALTARALSTFTKDELFPLQ